MKLKVKHYKELTLDELHGIYRYRVSVFVVEQICPYQEVDDNDNVSCICGWITDSIGIPIQHLQYLPYGEDWVDIQINLDPSLGQYTFNGKEKDHESGFHYYGARYYWSEVLTGWLSVDPMADKYPSISPYAYCAWNPVKLVDPDGDDLWIINGDEIIKYTAGMSNEGLEGFSRMVVNTLNKIYGEGGDEGAELVGALCASKNVFNIRQRDGIESEFIASNPYAAYARNNEAIVANWDVAVKYGWDSGSGGDVLWNTKGYPYITEDGVRDNPIYQLIHELGHAYDANLGIMDNRIYKGFPDDKGASLNDWSACARANCIGPYMGYPLQTVYGGSIDSFGKLIPGTGTRLYDSEGNPINPF